MKSEIECLVESEYQAIRGEIASQLVAIRNLEAGAVAGVGAMLAWLYANPDVPLIAWATPPALVVATGLRAFTFANGVKLLGTFIRERETALASADERSHGRWETWRAERSAGLVRSAWVFWGLLLTTALVAGGWAAVSPRTTSEPERGLTIQCLPDTAVASPKAFMLRCEAIGQ